MDNALQIKSIDYSPEISKQKLIIEIENDPSVGSLGYGRGKMVWTSGGLW